jgi:glycosyltransferase involved in cell wall biosynthesis
VIILTNIDRAPANWTAWNGQRGQSIFAPTFQGILRHVRRCDLVLINSDPTLLLQLSAIFAVAPFLRCPLLGSDIVLRKPEGLWQKTTLGLKRFLLARVDHFMHLFKDLNGYQQVFGIGPEKSSFTAFKPNLRYHCNAQPNPDGEYVLCLGWSMRDFDTFFAAVERLPYPAAIAKPDWAQLRKHGARFTRPLHRLPGQVRIIDHNPRDFQSQVELIASAKLVVVPMLKSCMVMAGTPYNAMLLGKCVILTDGPAVNGLFTDEVLPVPPEDPGALAEMIKRAWNDKELREKTAAAGYRCALALGGEAELAQRIIDQAVRWYGQYPLPQSCRCFV